MRNPKRIPEILKLFQEAWEMYPDDRFCQLIYNVVHLHTAPDLPDLFYVEDDLFKEALQKFF